MRKTYIWIVIAVVLCFLALIIAYSLAPADRNAAGGAPTADEKPH